ncbi:MAG: hypothetical protein AAF638_13115 [Pseudomonadota bacterium]
MTLLSAIEIIIGFGAVMGFLVWQMRSVNRRIEARKAGQDPDLAERSGRDARHSRNKNLQPK